jgi:hypothetical protein
MIPVFEREKTVHTSERAATVIGDSVVKQTKIYIYIYIYIVTDHYLPASFFKIIGLIINFNI